MSRAPPTQGSPPPTTCWSTCKPGRGRRERLRTHRRPEVSRNVYRRARARRSAASRRCEDRARTDTWIGPHVPLLVASARAEMRRLDGYVAAARAGTVPKAQALKDADRSSHAPWRPFAREKARLDGDLRHFQTTLRANLAQRVDRGADRPGHFARRRDPDLASHRLGHDALRRAPARTRRPARLGLRARGRSPGVRPRRGHRRDRRRSTRR